ncbi:MAG: hypothetical protein LBJ96_03530 [Holosporaceae bacterium]|jgi:hypothetical protein|nr:hypothetical protein [Holosporaceae bacterium]
MKKFAFLLYFVGLEAAAVSSVISEGLSAAASIKTLKGDSDFGLTGIFSSKGGISLEEVMLSVKENMNTNGAVRVHLVVVYDIELVGELMKRSSEQYFRHVDQLVKDYPDKIKIFEWELVAKEQDIPWTKIEYPDKHMMPLAGFIFAKYSGSGEHRARIPPTYKKVKITFKKDKFEIDYEDKDNKNKKEDS